MKMGLIQELLQINTNRRQRLEKSWRPQGDSNPCCRRERAVS
jgi:hypothetical protein